VVEYRSGSASQSQIAQHLTLCDQEFVPPLSDRLNLGEYAEKIACLATTCEAWSGGSLVGLVAGYCNDSNQRAAYITNVSVLRKWMGGGIAEKLVSDFIAHAREFELHEVVLEVACTNTAAIKLYKKVGFVSEITDTPFVKMTLYLGDGENHGRKT
jgi:ribosomal protein S18 acetylase RimI-like enzyme